MKIGFFVLIMTFPGAIINSVIQQLFCRTLRVAVINTNYVNIFSKMVDYEEPKDSTKHILITILPFITGTILGMIMAFPCMIEIDDKGAFNIIKSLTLWFGLSTVIHSIPKIENGKLLWENVFSNDKKFIQKIFTVPVIGFIYLINLLKVSDLITVIYGIVMINIPMIVISKLL